MTGASVVISEKPTMTLPDISTGSEEVAERKGVSNKKVAIISGAVVLLVAICVTGVVVGMHLTQKSSADIIEKTWTFEDGDGKKETEKITYDRDENLLQMSLPEQDAEIIYDYNRRIITTAVKIDDRKVCTLEPLDNQDPSENLPKLAIYQKPGDLREVETSANGSSTFNWKLSTEAVTDTSFLSEDAQEMCEGKLTYWLVPFTPKERQKRDLWLCIRCYYLYTIYNDGTWTRQTVCVYYYRYGGCDA